MTRPARLPLYGKVRLRSARKEKLLGLWHQVIDRTGVRIHDGIPVRRIERVPYGSEVETVTGTYATRTVVLAIGAFVGAGGYGERITKPEDIVPAIKRGIQKTKEGVPVLLEFITSKETEVSRPGT